jgi:hypothetical protein
MTTQVFKDDSQPTSKVGSPIEAIALWSVLLFVWGDDIAVEEKLLRFLRRHPMAGKMVSIVLPIRRNTSVFPVSPTPY